VSVSQIPFRAILGLESVSSGEAWT
jgi:hypothetical protein